MNVDITCQELVELVTGYLEGALPARERERFEHHLALCPGCVIYVEQMRETVRLTGERPREETLPRSSESRCLPSFAAGSSTRPSHARRVARHPQEPRASRRPSSTGE